MIGWNINLPNLTNSIPDFPSFLLHQSWTYYFIKILILFFFSNIQYNKHLFVHLNTSDYNPFNAYKNDMGSNGNVGDLSEDFELIHYKDVSDKFPESDLLWSLSNDQGLANKPTTPQASATYLIKFWVDLNYSLEENVSSLYAVTNM